MPATALQIRQMRKGRSPAPSLPSSSPLPSTSPSLSSATEAIETTAASSKAERGVTFPGSGSHSPQRGPQGPGVRRNTAHGGPGDSGRPESRASDLDTCAGAGSRPEGAAATRDSPYGGRAADRDPGSRWARAGEEGRDGSRPGSTAAGSGEPWWARPAPGRAQARSQGGRSATRGFRSFSVLRELRAAGAGEPRPNASPSTTRARQAPPRRTDVDVPSRRSATPSGREGAGTRSAAGGGAMEEWGGL